MNDTVYSYYTTICTTLKNELKNRTVMNDIVFFKSYGTCTIKQCIGVQCIVIYHID